MKKRLIAILLVLALAVVLMPAALAVEEYEAQIGTEKYSTLAEAIDVINYDNPESTTITLLKDVLVSEISIDDDPVGADHDAAYVITKTVTIDGGENRYSITVDPEMDIEKAFEIKNDTDEKITVTFKNLSIINYSQVASRCIDTRNDYVDIVLDNVKLDTTQGGGGYCQPITIGGSENGGVNVDIKNGSEINALKAGYALISFVKSNITISDSTLKGYGAIYMKEGTDGSVITLEDGAVIEGQNNFSGESNAFSAITFEDDGIKLNVKSGAEIKAKSVGTDSEPAYILLLNGHGADVTIEDGAIVDKDGTAGAILAGYDKENTENIKITVKDAAVKEALEIENFEVAADGAVSPKMVAGIGNAKYPTLQDAADAAVSGDTVKLLADITVTGATAPVLLVEDGENITLDLNGYDITSDYGWYTIDISNGGGKNGTATTGKLTIIGAGTVTNNHSTSTTIRNYGTLVIGETGAGAAASPVINRAEVTNKENSAVKNEETATLIINSGTINGNDRSIQNFGTATFNGGVFNEAVEGWKYRTYDSQIIINGGEFNGKVTTRYSEESQTFPAGAKIAIKGGTFTGVKYSDIKDYIAEGYMVVVSASGITVKEDVPPLVTPPVVEEDEECDGGLKCPSNYLVDVYPSEWYHDAVDFVVSKGLMGGVTCNTFAPLNNLTRAQMWTILARLDGVNTTPAAGEEWYKPGMEWAMAKGISDGTSPNAKITREQMVTMIWRYLGKPVSSGSYASFADAAKMSDWAEEAMEWAVQNGVIGGKPGNIIDPAGNARRADVAQVFMNYFGK